MLLQTIAALICLGLATAAPLATTTTLPIGIATITVDLVAPSEIPNTPLPIPTAGLPIPNTPSVAPQASPGGPSNSIAQLLRLLGLGRPPKLRRQIRVMDYDPTGNVSKPIVEKLLKRNKKSDAMAARLASMQAATAQPAPSSYPNQPASLMAGPTSAFQDLGETRMEGSDVFHEALKTVFSPNATQDDSQNDSQSDAQQPSPTVSLPSYLMHPSPKPMPSGPGYTVDTMDNAPPTAPKAARRGLEHKSVPGIVDLQINHGKRQTIGVDSNALLPESSPSADAGATSTPMAAWQQSGLLEVDSNRPPPPYPIGLTQTGVAKNSTAPHVTQAAPLNNVTHTA